MYPFLHIHFALFLFFMSAQDRSTSTSRSVPEDPSSPSLCAFLKYADIPSFYFILDSHRSILYGFTFINLDTPSRRLLWNPHSRCMVSRSTRNGSS